MGEGTDYLRDIGINVRYLHSEIDAIERGPPPAFGHPLPSDGRGRRARRKGEFDVLVGINLLREGLDLPEVSLVAILDADKQGYLRSATNLIQTAGRAARHLQGEVILYADGKTQSIQKPRAGSESRRRKRTAYKPENGLTPRRVVQPLEDPGFPEASRSKRGKLGRGRDCCCPWDIPHSPSARFQTS